MSRQVDLDDTRGCPVGYRCESCGTEHGSLEVETAKSQLGIMCLTLCRRCAAFDDLMPVSITTAVRLVAQHCEHLGIDVDEMAAVMERDG